MTVFYSIFVQERLKASQGENSDCFLELLTIRNKNLWTFNSTVPQVPLMQTEKRFTFEKENNTHFFL